MQFFKCPHLDLPNAFAREENQQLANHQPGVFDEPPATELFLTPDDVGAELRVSRGDLKRLRDAVLGPAYFTIGSTIRYLQADVDQ